MGNSDLILQEDEGLYVADENDGTGEVSDGDYRLVTCLLTVGERGL